MRRHQSHEKRVLFICVENACRSQMAEAFFNEMASGRAEAISAGTKPADRVNSNAVKVMKEVGVDVSNQRPKLLTLDMVKKVDKVITMGCGANVCPIVPKEVEEWELEDPSGKSIEKFREVRDEIKRRVERLLNEVGCTSHSDC